MDARVKPARDSLVRAALVKTAPGHRLLPFYLAFIRISGRYSKCMVS